MEATVPLAATPSGNSLGLRFAIAVPAALVAFAGIAFFARPSQRHQALRTGIVAGVAIGVFSWTVLQAADRRNKVRFVVADGQLTIRGDLFGKSYPLSSLKLDQAEAVDLSGPGPYALRWKLFGTGMPGYWSGDFSLKDGETAKVFVSDRTRVLRIPTADGSALLLSVEDPVGFKALLAKARAEAAS